MSTDTPDTQAAQAETHAFQADVQQVLKLVIHSLYSNRDIFLRELVSNASDACEKLRFEALANPGLLADGGDLAIDIVADRESRTLSLRDNGIGMSREELMRNLGTVAHSGTKRFLESIAAGQQVDAQLIGQFGVGFYSAFIVADEIAVTSRRAGSDEAWTWRSHGDGQFSMEPAPADTPRGTTLYLHLREDADDYLQDWKLRSLVRTYSDHVGFPIRMLKPVAKTEDDAETPVPELETVNQASALWTRAKTELSDDDYKGFYKHLSHDFADPLAWTHNRVEGNQNFTSLLYLPAHAPFDFQAGRDERKGLKLYIKRIFIMDAAEQMLPAYLRFARGVIDSDDLPLNVSRELLQESRQVERIKGALAKRVLDLLEKIARDEPENYTTFWDAFGAVLKEGVVEDAANRERVLKLLRFATTRSESADQRISLDDYIGRMAGLQEDIYYLTADGWNAARHHPKLEALKARGIEVLLLHERIDDWMSSYFHEYAGKRLRNVAKGEIDLDKLGGEEDKAKQEEAAQAAAPLVEKLKTALGDRVKDVRVSNRLVDSAACLVVDEYDMSLHMQRLFAAAGQAVPPSQPILEINPGHALIKRVEAVEGDDALVADYAALVFEQAMLAEGGTLDDPASFIARMNRLLLG
ncbi:MAG: molecular chaperone HtpG [Xanthomonadaceae bacterium]|nr:molecular chaperone HtpG [Xanthomonadaceae bacterium]